MESQERILAKADTKKHPNTTKPHFFILEEKNNEKNY